MAQEGLALLAKIEGRFGPLATIKGQDQSQAWALTPLPKG
jgi:hypothetical protein